MPITQLTMAFVVIVTAILAQSGSVYAQTMLDIEGAHISLGMDRQTVLTQFKDKDYLRLYCSSQEDKGLADCDSVMLVSRRQPSDAYANIVFEDEKVKSVRKYWSRGYEGTEPGKFVQTLFSLLANHPTTEAQFRVSISERLDPGRTQQTIFLTSGRKTISISYADGFRGDDGKTIPPFVHLDEVIGDE